MTSTTTNCTKTVALCLATLLALPHVADACRPTHVNCVALMAPAEPALPADHGLQATWGSIYFSAVDHPTQRLWLASGNNQLSGRTPKLAKLTRTVEPKNECFVRRQSLA
jgi:hypothetical protein